MDRGRTLLIVQLFLSLAAWSQELHWVNRLGLAGESLITEVCTDARDNVYVLGSMNNSGSVDLDPGPASHLLSWNFGDLPGAGYFLAKYDSTGLFQWGYKADNVRAFAVSPSGSVVLAFVLEGSFDADPGPGSYPLNAVDGCAVVRWSTDGEFISGFAVEGAHIAHVAIDPSGNGYVLGNFIETIDSDPGPGTTSLSSLGYYDLWLAKYDASDELAWAHAIGGAGQDYATDLSLHNASLYVTLRTVGSVDIDQIDVDPDVDVALTTFTQNQGAAAMEYALDGSYQQHASFDWPVASRAPVIRWMPDNGVVLAGGFAGHAQFVSADSTYVLNSSGYDAFIHRLGWDWEPVWTDLFTAYGNEPIYDMVPGKDGAILVCGLFTHSIDVDPGPGVIEYVDAPPGATWIGSYCFSDGSRIWSAMVNGQDRDLFHAMEWTPTDALLLAGQVSSGADLGLGGPPQLVSTAASSSAFIARYRQVGTQCVPAGVGVNDAVSGHRSAISLHGDLLEVRWEGSVAELNIVDPQGRSVHRERSFGSGTALSIADWASGLYIVCVSGPSGTWAERIIVR